MVWGFPAQVTAHYVAMTPNGKVFDSSLDRGFPYDIRVGAGQVEISSASCLPFLCQGFVGALTACRPSPLT